MEKWLPVVGFEGIYEVSSNGRVRVGFGVNYGHYARGSEIIPQRQKNGYLHVKLWKERSSKTKTVHSMVLEAFVGPRPSGLVSRHLDGSRDNNCASNLDWGTHFQNRKDCIGHGTDNKGSKHGIAKLFESDVLEIRRLAGSGVTNRQIAKRFGVSPQNIGFIVNRKTWSHI